MDGRLAIDSAVLLLYFVLIISIGLYMGRKEENLKDFALGGRRIPWWAVLASLIAAETSAGTFFGTPGEGFTLSATTPICSSRFGTIIARILVSYIFIKPYYDYKVFSIYEYLTARFGVATKNAASAVFLFTRLLASGARLYVAAIALALAYEMITRRSTKSNANSLDLHRRNRCHRHFDRDLYHAWWNQSRDLDRFHSSVDHDRQRAHCARVALLRDSRRLARNRATPRRIPRFRFHHHRSRSGQTWLGQDGKACSQIEYTIFAGLIGSTFMTMATHGTDQDMVQRMLTAPDIRRSRRSLILSGLADIPIAFTFLSIGVLLWVFYQTHHDPAARKLRTKSFVITFFIEMPVGLRGLLIAGIFATAMGSLSTAINALATSFTRDWYEPYINPGADEATKSSRRALGHGLVFAPDDRRRFYHSLSRHRLPKCANHSDCARDFRLYLRLACWAFFSPAC